METYFEDLRQDEKHVPDLLESIMGPTDPVFKIDQFGSEIKKIRVSTFWIPEIQSFRAAGQCQPSHQLVLSPINNNNGPPSPNKCKK